MRSVPGTQRTTPPPSRGPLRGPGPQGEGEESAGRRPVDMTGLGKLTKGLVAALHLVAHAVLGVAVLLAVLLAGAAWRLAQGPVDLSWLTARLEATVNTPDSPIRLRIGDTALAWEGFREGVDHPIDLRLTNLTLTDASGHPRLAVPQAELSLSLGALLVGRLQPRAIELDRPRLLFHRAADGTLNLDLGSPPDRPDSSAGNPVPALLAELARPPASDRSAMRGWLSQIRRVRIHDAAVTMQDQQNGVTWQAPQAEIDLTRDPAGGVSGSADLALVLADQRARLHMTATLSAAATQTRIIAQLTPVAPAALARLVPGLAPLAALDAPVGTEASLRLGPNLGLQHFRLTLRAGSGAAHIGQSAVPVVAATVTADGTPDLVQIESARVILRGVPSGPASTVNASGTLRRDSGHIDAVFAFDLDHVEFADLPHLWPVGIAGPARRWVTNNITAGLARDAHVQVTLTASDDLSNIDLTQASGTLVGEGLTVHWLRPVPPIENGRAQLRILGPDALEIAVLGGRQALRNGTGGLTIKSGSMRITGLMQPDQIGTIQGDIAGSVQDALALLREPRLRLLAAHPMPLTNPAGQISATVSVRLPLEADLSMDDVAIHAAARLDGVHLDDVAAGRPMDQGRLALDATNDGLTVKGDAKLAGIAAQLDAAMDFRAGAPSQVVQLVTVSGRPDAGQLAAAGLDTAGLLSGPVPIRMVLTEHRNGAGTLAVQADLTPATLQVEQLAWRKPAGTPAAASLQLRLRHDRLDGIDRLDVTGDGLSAQGSAACVDGRVSLIRLDRLVLGRSDLHATVRLPATRASPIVVDVAGPVLDLSARLARTHQPSAAPATEPPPGPPWTLDARFDRVLMANGFLLRPVSVQAENDGRVFRRLSVAGDTRDQGPFDLRITPEGDQRRLTASVVQAGDLLRALDWLKTMQGGRLTLSGTYDDSKPGHPLSGTAKLTDFRVREATVLGKLLQSMTLYGLVDALRGPGLSFTRAVVPFRLASDVLELSDARASSPSLGLTAKGRIDLNAERVDVQGTIVPAYFFNSLLGHLPLIGKLLSPEQGGGVFAASYTLRGKLDDPDVSVNPLSALTPGFLRGLFGAF